jgi:hypothetical protein
MGNWTSLPHILSNPLPPTRGYYYYYHYYSAQPTQPSPAQQPTAEKQISRKTLI